MNENEAFSPKDLHKYAWDYFQLHAGQRMSLFNFFVVLAVLMTSALVATFQKDFKMPLIGMGVGLCLSFIAFVCWKLDQRVRYFLKNAERAFAKLEAAFPTVTSNAEPHATQLVRWEAYQTEKLRAVHCRWAPNAQFSYAQSLHLMFVIFGFGGLLGSIVSLLRYVGWLP
jgi:hypothetical protein